MRITWAKHSLDIEQDSIVFVQQSKIPFQVKFEGCKSSLLINSTQLNHWNQQSLEKVYQSSRCSFDELKQYLKNSPFASILRTKFKKISNLKEILLS